MPHPSMWPTLLVLNRFPIFINVILTNKAEHFSKNASLKYYHLFSINRIFFIIIYYYINIRYYILM